MKKILLFIAVLVSMLSGTVTEVFCATRTWTGTTSSDWQVASNWNGGIPGAGDVARFTQTGVNRDITNVPTTTLQQIIVTTTGASVSYSFSSAGPVTITLANGSTGIDFWVVSGCELILNPGVSLTINGALTTAIAGNLVLGGSFNVNTTGNIVVDGTVHMNETIAMNNNRTITGTGTWYVDPDKTMTVSTSGARFVLQTANIVNNGTIAVSSYSEFRPEPGTAMTSSATSYIDLAGPGILRPSGTCSMSNITTDAGSLFRISAGTLTSTGTSVISGTINVVSGATLVIDGDLTLAAGAVMTHGGNITINANHTLNSHVSFSSGSNTTMNVNGILSFGTGVTWTLVGPTAGCIVSSTGNITGEGNMTHTSGTLTVNGLITVGGDFSNASPLTGTGTIEIGGAFTNTSTMFVYPGIPPGKIISGYTWRGLTNTAWATNTNWWAGAVPVSTGDAVIYSTLNRPFITTAGQNCRRLYIHNDASLVTIAPGGQLTASGKTTLGGGGGTGGTTKLILTSTAAGTGSFIDNGTFDGVGLVTAERFLSYGASGQWHYICIPMTQINAFTYFDQYLKYYNEPVHHFMYVIAPSDSVLNSVGLGYAVWPKYSDYLAFQTGVPNTGIVNIPVTRAYNTMTGDYDGWNLVGNPFTSAIDLSQSLQTGISTNLDPSAWFWDPAAGNYTVYPLGGGGSHSQYCPAGQGYFTHCNDPGATPSTPGTGILKLLPQSRVHHTEVFLKETKADILKVKVIGSPNAFRDEMSIYFDDALTAGYDPGYDAVKIEGHPDAPQISSVSDEIELAVNAQPFEGSSVIPMNFRCGQFGNFMLTFSEMESFDPGIGIRLEDLAEGIIQDIRANPSYTFSHTPQDDPARFIIRFTESGLEADEFPPAESIKIYSSGHSIMISGQGQEVITAEVTVYDLLGRTIVTQDLDGQVSYRLDLPAVHGYYLVRVVRDPSPTVKKVYLE